MRILIQSASNSRSFVLTDTYIDLDLSSSSALFLIPLKVYNTNHALLIDIQCSFFVLFFFFCFVFVFFFIFRFCCIGLPLGLLIESLYFFHVLVFILSPILLPLPSSLSLSLSLYLSLSLSLSLSLKKKKKKNSAIYTYYLVELQVYNL